MPWKSDAQRRWGHSAAGEKALGGPAKVAEFDSASKGLALPERVKGGKVGSKKAMPDSSLTVGQQEGTTALETGGRAAVASGTYKSDAHPELAKGSQIAGPAEIMGQIKAGVRAVSNFMQGHMNSSGSKRSPSTISDRKP